MIIDDEVKAIFLVVILVVGVFTVSQALAGGRIVDPFSELAVLGPNQKITDYPRTVVTGQFFHLYLYVGNQEGHVMFYRIMVKLDLGGQTGNVSDTQPLETTPLAFYEQVIQHGGNYTTPITLSLTEAGLNQRLVFELWAYNEDTNQFHYHSRYCQLWLNVTQPST